MIEKIDWLYQLKTQVPSFLDQMKGVKRRGFYKYSYSGDYFGESIKWGLANTVFAVKIYHLLGISNRHQSELEDALSFIHSFQTTSGQISDSLISWLSIPARISYYLKTGDNNNLFNDETSRAETRQSLSALYLSSYEPQYYFNDFPQTQQTIESFLSNLDWHKPWKAGSHFSHLLFFLEHSKLGDKKTLINFAINWVSRLQKDDGFWYLGNPSMAEKINGAMKIITGLECVNAVKFNETKKIIDCCLANSHNRQACDNFNIVYVLRWSSEVLNHSYRIKEIRQFMLNRLAIYKSHYFPQIGGFSFRSGKADIYLYGAPLTRGLPEPDIHGTIMFLWGISQIAIMLGIQDEVQFQEIIP